MTIWVFENSYYVGNDKEVQEKATRSEEMALKENEEIIVKDGVIKIQTKSENEIY